MAIASVCRASFRTSIGVRLSSGRARRGLARQLINWGALFQITGEDRYRDAQVDTYFRQACEPSFW